MRRYSNQQDEMSPAERDLRTSALNSASSIRLLNEIRDRLGGPAVPASGFGSAAGFLAAVRRPSSESMVRYITNAVTTYGREAIGGDGGFVVPPDFNADVLQPVLGSGSLLGAFRPVTTTSNLVIVGVDETAEWGTTGVEVQAVGEGSATTETKGVLRQVNVQLYKASALVPASEEIEDDSSGSFGNFVWRACSRRLKNKIERWILWGSGVGEPLGCFNAPALVTVAKEGSQAAATIQKENVEKMVGRLLPGSFPTSIWVVHTSALVKVMDLGSGGGIYNPDGASPFGYGTLLGRPVAVSEHANPLGSLGDILLVDPECFLYATQGVRNVSTIEFRFDQHLKSFRSSIRVGGAPLISAPIARRTGSETLSCCVTLEARS